MYMLTPPRSHSGRFSDAETGPKVKEELTWQSLCHHIRKLKRGGDMENSDISQGHLLADEVYVDLNVLSTQIGRAHV